VSFVNPSLLVVNLVNPSLPMVSFVNPSLLMVNLVSPSLLVARPNTKSASTMHLPTCCLVCAGPCEWLSAYHSS
jgi:hypothetical protein